jgi:uncharacterized protein YegL
MKGILVSVVTIGVVAAIVFGTTRSFFSDTESSIENILHAGSIDLKIDNECHYNGMSCIGGFWRGEPGGYPKAGDPCECSWTVDNWVDGKAIFSFTDVKPGDFGEQTISLHVDNNPAWVCAEIADIKSEEVSCNTPEELAEPGCEADNVGELLGNIKFDIWNDDGAGDHRCNNLKDEDETYLVQGAVVQDLDWPVADSTTGNGPITDTCIGVAWSIEDTAGNEIQTDLVSGSLRFSAIQARHNDNYVCQGECLDEADVMLVLDRSGSINSSELSQLKSASLAFVSALNPDGGVHVGQSSFATVGSLDLQLTGNIASIQGAINSLVSGGFTNLYDGIRIANAELKSVRDRDDSTTPDYMVIVTDGNPNEPGSDSNARAMAATEAANAKAAGVTIYVVGVGGDVDSNYLRNSIATGPAYYFGIADYTSLESILKEIASCEQEQGKKPEVIFSDGFGEGATLADVPGWEENDGSGNSTVARDPFLVGNNSASPDGGRFAQIGGTGGWICRNFNATGYEGLSLSFYRRGDLNSEASDRGRVEYFTTGTCSSPSGVVELASYNLNADILGWSGQEVISLPSSLDNTSFFIRFRVESSQTDEDFRVDGINLSGIAI